jgi:galactokinase
VVTENERTCRAAAAMRRGDAPALGELMNGSHESLRHDFEVSSPALDAMVDCARRAPGCLGARMTGAGFGGCAIAMVRKGGEEALKARVFERYPKDTGIKPEVYVSAPSDGAKAENLD